MAINFTYIVDQSYRPDIDALRAIAIIVVGLFHFGVPGFSGGFVGVDLFFVVSGYLITRNILSNLSKGQFTLLGFFVRRIRRIMPSLMAMALAVTAVGYVVLPPAFLTETAKSSVWALFFFSNIHFWSQVGYFDAEKYTKPLLHTWSLGIEEQFYLIWPVTLLIALRIAGERLTLALILVATVASFLLTAFWVASVTVSVPYLGTKFTEMADAFYLLPFRMWELALGGLTAFPAIAHISDRIPRSLRHPICAAGIGAIAWCVSQYLPHMPFPGLAALPVCLAAAGLILAGRLSLMDLLAVPRAVRHIGQLSYSLYLTHWPVIVLYKLSTYEEPDLFTTAALIAVSVALAEVLHRIVEQPFRAGALSTLSGMRVSGWVAVYAGMITICAVTYVIVGERGLPSRMLVSCSEDCSVFKPRAHRVQGALDIATRFDGGMGLVGADPGSGYQAILIGDSHAGHLTPTLDTIGRKLGISIETWTLPGCPPIFGTYKIYWRSGLSEPSPTQVTCARQIGLWRDHVLATPRGYDLVIIAGRWAHLYEPLEYGDLNIEYAQLAVPRMPLGTREAGRTIFAEKLTETLRSIEATGSSVLVVGQVPNVGRVIDHCSDLSRFVYAGSNLTAAVARRCRGIPRTAALERLAFTDATITKAVRPPLSRAFLPDKLFCPASEPSCLTVKDGRQLYRNADHISTAGARLIEPDLEHVISELLAARCTRRQERFCDPLGRSRLK